MSFSLNIIEKGMTQPLFKFVLSTENIENDDSWKEYISQVVFINSKYMP